MSQVPPLPRQFPAAFASKTPRETLIVYGIYKVQNTSKAYTTLLVYDRVLSDDKGNAIIEREPNRRVLRYSTTNEEIWKGFAASELDL